MPGEPSVSAAPVCLHNRPRWLCYPCLFAFGYRPIWKPSGVIVNA